MFLSVQLIQQENSTVLSSIPHLEVHMCTNTIVMHTNASLCAADSIGKCDSALKYPIFGMTFMQITYIIFNFPDIVFITTTILAIMLFVGHYNKNK